MLRFFCTPGPLLYGSWAKLSYEYLTAFAAKRKIRAISAAGGIPLNCGEWSRVADLFATPLPDTFSANIICAPLDFLDRLWTKDLYNIAIVGGPCSEASVIQAKSVLEKYAEIWVAGETLLEYYYGSFLYVPSWTANERITLLGKG